MKTVDLFILFRFLTYFLGALMILIVLFLSVDIMTNLNRFNASGSILMSYYIYYIPFIAYNMIPVSALLALVSVVSGLVRTSELVALHSLGYSLPALLKSVLAFLIILVLLLIWLGDVVIPYATEKRNYIYYVEMKKQPDRYAKTKTRNIWYRTKSAIIHFDNILDENNISGAQIYFVSRDWSLVRMIEAKGLFFKADIWLLKDVKDSSIIAEQEAFNTVFHKQLELPALTVLESMKMNGDAIDSLGIRELASLIKKNQEVYLDTTQLKVTLYSKFSFAITALILPLLGLCTISTNRRSGNMFLSVGIAVGLVFMYWTLYNTALSLGKAGTLNPLFGVIIVPVVVLVGILFAIRRVLN